MHKIEGSCQTPSRLREPNRKYRVGRSKKSIGLTGGKLGPCMGVVGREFALKENVDSSLRSRVSFSGFFFFFFFFRGFGAVA